MTNGNPKFFSKVSDFWNTVSGNYFVIGYYKNTHKYLKYDNVTGANEFVDSPKDATCFDFILGTLIVSKMRNAYPAMEFSLQDVNNAMFIHDVTGEIKEKPSVREGYTAEDTNPDSTPVGLEQIRITKLGIAYYMGFPSVNNPNIPPDIQFLKILTDAQWHNKNEFVNKIQDLPEIIIAALQNNLIEMK